MTLQEIKRAVENGQTVHWKNPAYRVVKDRLGQWFITSNTDSIGLTHSNGVTLNGQPGDFYIANHEPVAEWRAQRLNIRDWCVVNTDAAHPIHVRIEKAFGETDADVEARARRIAALPKLYAACQQVLADSHTGVYLSKAALTAIKDALAATEAP